MFLYFKVLVFIIGTMFSYEVTSIDLTIINEGYFGNGVNLYIKKPWGCCWCCCTKTTLHTDRVDGTKTIKIDDDAIEIRLEVVGKFGAYDLGRFSFLNKASGGTITMEYEDADTWGSSAIGMEKR